MKISKEKTKNSNIDIQHKIETILKKVRPYIQMHGGDVILIGVEKGVVTLKISGACAHCRMADLTYNNMIYSLIKDEVKEIKKIILVK